MAESRTVESEATYDLVLRGGIVYDGTGAAGKRADVGVLGDRIVAVGDLSLAQAGVVLDVTGRCVAPGFIDIHTHSDISINYDPGQASSLAMGVTTQVVGNCGLSIGLAVDSDVFDFEKRWLAPHRARITWNSFADHLEQVEARGTANNFLPLVGHGTLRKLVMGMGERPPDATELTTMQRTLASAMEAGAWGFSSGLEYPPSSYADEDELTELCRIVAQHGGLYATHLRNEGDTLVEAVQEALNVAERAGLPLQLSHHKAEGQTNWGKINTTLAMVEAARGRGRDIQLDQYPYTAFMTGLAIQTLPRWALSGTPEETQQRLIDPTQRAAIRAEMLANHPEWDDLSLASPWHKMQIGVSRSRPEIQGRTLSELAAEAGEHPIDYVLNLLAEPGGFVSAVNFAIGEEDIATVMRYPWTSIGSDGVGTHPDGTAGKDQIHPRAYGTFTRVLGRYVRELGVLDFATALHKMTGLPAARLGLHERGKIAPGQYADITVFDPAQVGDLATFAEPHQFSVGIEAVLVNGRFALRDGQVTDHLAGRVLRK